VCVCVCDLGTSRMRRPGPLLGYNAIEERCVSFSSIREDYLIGLS